MQLNSPRLRTSGPTRSGRIFKSAEYMHIRAVAHTQTMRHNPRITTAGMAVERSWRLNWAGVPPAASKSI